MYVDRSRKFFGFFYLFMVKVDERGNWFIRVVFCDWEGWFEEGVRMLCEGFFMLV